MKAEYVRVDGKENGIDFDAHYRINGWRGIAFYLLGWATTQEQDESGERETVPDYDNVVAVMVGDDRRHVVSKDDLEILAADKFCRSCGQIGCRCNVYA